MNAEQVLERTTESPAPAAPGTERPADGDSVLEEAWLRAYRDVVMALDVGDAQSAFRILMRPPQRHRFYGPDEVVQRNDMRAELYFIRAFLPAIDDGEMRIGFMQLFTESQTSFRAAYVVHAELLLDAERPCEAAEQLRKALALVYDDVHTQTLFLRATGGESPLRVQGGSPKFCRMPFDNFEILDGGDVYLCGNVNLPHPVGNVYKSGWEEIWNGPRAQELRRSVLDGDFQYCSPMTCPLQRGLPNRDALPADQRRWLDGRVKVVPPKLRRLSLAYDRSCNLTCPQCRNDKIMAPGAEKKRLDAMSDNVVLPLLKHAKVVNITGSGDPFGSPHFRRLLNQLNIDDYPELAIDLMTNAVLLKPRAWDGEFRHLHAMFNEIMVSIDGASRDVYMSVRPDSDYDALLTNMDYLAENRRKGAPRKLAVAMVVQECNFREMKTLLEMCLEWGVDEVRFYKLRQWGTYPPDEFIERDVVNPRHPQHYEFLDALEDPIFGDRIVNPFELGQFIPIPGSRQQKSASS